MLAAAKLSAKFRAFLLLSFNEDSAEDAFVSPLLGSATSWKSMVLKSKLYIAHFWTVYLPLNTTPARLCLKQCTYCHRQRFRITGPCSWIDQSEHNGRPCASLHPFLSHLTFHSRKFVFFELQNHAMGSYLRILSCLDPLPYFRYHHSLRMQTPLLTQSPHR